MELKLISGLEHQQIAVDKIAAAFAGVATADRETKPLASYREKKHFLHTKPEASSPLAGAFSTRSLRGFVTLCATE